MPAESAAKVGGAAPKDRYERELVLTGSSVRCQAKTADLLPPRTRMTDGSAGADSCCGPPPPVTCALSSWPGAGCLPAGPGSAGRQGRAPAPLRRAPLPGQRGGLPGDLCSPTVSRSGPRSPLFNVWAVRLLSLSGVTPGSWPGSAFGPASCFAGRYLHVCAASRRLPRAGGPGCAGRRSVVAGGGMPHLRATTATGSAAAVVTRRSPRWPHGRAGAVVHECAGQAGDRVRGFPAGGGDDQICCKLPAGR